MPKHADASPIPWSVGDTIRFGATCGEKFEAEDFICHHPPDLESNLQDWFGIDQSADAIAEIGPEDLPRRRAYHPKHGAKDGRYSCLLYAYVGVLEDQTHAVAVC